MGSQYRYVSRYTKLVYSIIVYSISLSPEDNTKMAIAITNIIDLGLVTKCYPKKQYISSTFFNDSCRFILNLNSFNKFVTITHFEMEDYRTASKLILHNGFIAP